MIDWQKRWQDNLIGWHKTSVNTRLVKFLVHLDLKPNNIVFVPLCGKSLDMFYLIKKGYQVIGVELSEKAVRDFFSEHSLNYQTHTEKNFTIYAGERIRIYVGDYFKLKKEVLKNVHGVYDRASLIALDKKERALYAEHLAYILPDCVQILLLVLDYPQGQMSGPPFALTNEEVYSLFHRFEITQLECKNDLANEAKFLEEGVDFLHKVSYLLISKKCYEVKSVAR